jgi:AP-1 complex subunit gamma-1
MSWLLAVMSVCLCFVDLPSITAYEKNGLKIVFCLERLPENPNTTVIRMSAMNETINPITEFLFQAAVPKVSQCNEICLSPFTRKLEGALEDVREITVLT